jgi:ComF family protein
MFLTKRYAVDLLNLLFPNLCNACGAPLFHGEQILCTSCLFDLPFTDFHLYSDNQVAKQFWGRLTIHAAMSLLYFSKGLKVQHMIHALKYKGKSQIGRMLGNMIGKALLTAPLYQGVSLIIPVPLHPLQQRKRGYNQSKCIADGIAEILDVPVNERSLIRVVKTESQTKKTRFNRYLNMSYVFSVIRKEDIEHHHILLVDDVMTTGSTLEACGLALLSHNIDKLSMATIAFVK